jgi:hypothetical protein
MLQMQMQMMAVMDGVTDVEAVGLQRVLVMKTFAVTTTELLVVVAVVEVIKSTAATEKSHLVSNAGHVIAYCHRNSTALLIPTTILILAPIQLVIVNMTSSLMVQALVQLFATDTEIDTPTAAIVIFMRDLKNDFQDCFMEMQAVIAAAAATTTTTTAATKTMTVKTTGAVTMAPEMICRFPIKPMIYF